MVARYKKSESNFGTVNKILREREIRNAEKFISHSQVSGVREYYYYVDAVGTNESTGTAVLSLYKFSRKTAEKIMLLDANIALNRAVLTTEFNGFGPCIDESEEYKAREERLTRRYITQRKRLLFGENTVIAPDAYLTAPSSKYGLGSIVDQKDEKRMVPNRDARARKKQIKEESSSEALFAAVKALGNSIDPEIDLRLKEKAKTVILDSDGNFDERRYAEWKLWVTRVVATGKFRDYLADCESNLDYLSEYRNMLETRTEWDDRLNTYDMIVTTLIRMGLFSEATKEARIGLDEINKQPTKFTYPQFCKDDMFGRMGEISFIEGDYLRARKHWEAVPVKDRSTWIDDRLKYLDCPEDTPEVRLAQMFKGYNPISLWNHGENLPGPRLLGPGMEGFPVYSY